MAKSALVLRTTRGGQDSDFYIHVLPAGIELNEYDPWQDADIIEDNALVSYLKSEKELQKWLKDNNYEEESSLEAVGY